MKTLLRNRAILLRKNGLSYTEILESVPVAKSTLSLWLRSVSLSKRQKQRLSVKRIAAARRGSLSRKKKREQGTLKIKQSAISEVGHINRRDLWLMGIMLHWAEGSKPKHLYPSVGVIFSNSDERMIKIYLLWLEKILNISIREIKTSIYIHETCKRNIVEVKNHWAKATGLPLRKFDKIYFKRNILSPRKKYFNQEYFGLLRVKVLKSTNLNRKISGWIEGVCLNAG